MFKGAVDEALVRALEGGAVEKAPRGMGIEVQAGRYISGHVLSGLAYALINRLLKQKLMNSRAIKVSVLILP